MLGDLVERGQEFPDRGAGAAAEVDAVTGPGRASNRESAATCAVARSQTWM
jgi:hypothetical protein